MSCLNSARCRYSYRKYETKRIQRKIERGGGNKRGNKSWREKEGLERVQGWLHRARVGCIVTHTHTHTRGRERRRHTVYVHALVIFANHWLATVFKYYWPYVRIMYRLASMRYISYIGGCTKKWSAGWGLKLANPPIGHDRRISGVYIGASRCTA